MQTFGVFSLGLLLVLRVVALVHVLLGAGDLVVLDGDVLGVVGGAGLVVEAFEGVLKVLGGVVQLDELDLLLPGLLF